MPSKLGFQLHDGANSTSALDRLRQMRPAALLVVGNTDLLNRAYDTLGAGILYLYQAGGTEDFINAAGDLSARVDRFLNARERAFQAVPWAYHLTFPQTTVTAAGAEFEALAVRLAWERYNVRLCIGNFAANTPAPDSWSVYRPALNAVVRYSGLVGLREAYPVLPYVGYGPGTNLPNINANTPRKLLNEVPYPQNYKQPAQIVGRYRYLRDYCAAQKLPVQMVITESGAGRSLPDWMNALGANLNGWQSLVSLWRRFGYTDAPAHYFEDIYWLDQHVYSHDPAVLAFCVAAWNAPSLPTHEIGTSAALLNFLGLHLQNSRPAPTYTEQPLNPPSKFKVTASRVRVRPTPTTNNKFTANLDYGQELTATHYSFNAGFLWLKHSDGWTAYTPLENGNPEYDEKFLEGVLITTPRQDAATQNFVGTIEEVRSFLAAHQGQLFYVSINPGLTPEGARTFSITTFPANQARRIINALHPAAGDPRMTPEARRKLGEAGQL